MRILSTFTGIGGFEVGIQNAYRTANRRKQANTSRDDEKGQGLVAAAGKSPDSEDRRAGSSTTDISNEGPLFIGYSEIDKHAISVYERHSPGVRNYGDITKINAQELPDFDCLVGGFPCQAFSIAGKRAGFDDTRGTLFFDLARILREKQPRYFVFENVKGLLSHDQGRTFTTIVATLDELGYDCQWQVLNSKDFGVPQNRERVIIVGHLRGTPRPQVFPIGENDEDSSFGDKEKQGRQISATLTVRNASGNNCRGTYATAGSQIRRITPLECERLQAFPDDWTKYGEDKKGVRVKISDTQRYKMCGNAVTTNVIQKVFERIFDHEPAKK